MIGVFYPDLKTPLGLRCILASAGCVSHPALVASQAGRGTRYGHQCKVRVGEEERENLNDRVVMGFFRSHGHEMSPRPSTFLGKGVDGQPLPELRVVA